MTGNHKGQEVGEWLTVEREPLSERAGFSWLLLILALYLALAIGYNIVNPLFEAPDEHLHFFAAQHIADTGRLPSTRDPASAPAWQAAAHPPLYYLLSAPIIGPIKATGAEKKLWMNPRVRWGDSEAGDNVNTFIHTPTEEWPWSGYVLAGHLIRAFSTFLGLGTLLFIFGGVRLFWKASVLPALLVTALVAFLPQYIFLHASASNDPLIIFLSTFALWQLLRIWFHGLSHSRLIVLGLTVGLAILSKTAGLLLLLYAVIFVSIVSWREISGKERWWRIARSIAFIVVPALLISGWQLWRNLSLYGDLTATNEIVRLAGTGQSYSLGQVLPAFTGLWRSSVAVFGWFNITAPVWIYLFWVGLVVSAVIGAVRLRGRIPSGELQAGSVSKQLLPLAGLLFAWILLVVFGLVLWMLQVPAGQGRLIFPALLPVAVAMSYGLYAYHNRWVYLLISIVALATSIYCLVIVIPEAYARPALLHETEIDAAAQRLDVEMGSDLRIIAAQLETEQVEPGETVWLTLYWRKDGPSPSEESLRNAREYVLEIIGRDTQLIGKKQSFHGGGLYPSSLWPPDQVVQDRVGIRLDSESAAPTAGQLFVHLAGGEMTVKLGEVKVAPATWPKATEVTLADFSGIELVSAEIGETVAAGGDTVPIHLRWQVGQAPSRDLTTFVHLGDSDKPPLTQGDSPPFDGHYPTRLWAEGEVIDDRYSLPIPSDLPDGRYPVFIGLYDSLTGVRVPLMVEGIRQPHDAYLVGWLLVGGN